jgi:GT2 family glycosyltransferase
MAEHEVTVIIPTLRAADDLISCLESVEGNLDAPPHEVLVVFNSPMPADIELEKHHATARGIQARTNLGFAAACNLGASEAVGETIIFLNDDMYVRPGWMKNLTSSMEERETEAVGGRVLFEEGKKIDFAGASVNLLGWGFQLGHNEPASEDEFITHQRLPFACGGNFAIKADAFHEVGGFDGDYFAFYEDVDLGWRLRLTGREISYAPDAVTIHSPGRTGALIDPAVKWFLQERNTLQTIMKNYSDDVLWRILPVAFALVGVRAEILSGLDITDIAHDKTWREWIFGADQPEIEEQQTVWRGIMDHVKESVKSGMKASRKASLPHGYLPLDSRGVGGLMALEWCLGNWVGIMEKRAKVQEMRTKTDQEILPVFDDPLRPVLGHPREIEAMKPLEGILNRIMRG